MTITVNAFGKNIQFPAGTAPEEIEKHIKNNQSLLDPDYKEPGVIDGLKRFGKEFAQNSLGVDMGVDTSNQPTGQDYLKGFASGANKLVSGAGYLAELAGAEETGKSIREFGDRGAAYWNNKMSGGGRAAAGTPVFEDDPESITGIRLTDDWGTALLMGAAQSTPTMFAAAIPGALATKGIQKLASLGLAGGTGATIPLLAGTAAPVGVTSNLIARTPAAVGFGAAEGVTSGAINAADFKSSIEEMSFDELGKSPVFQALAEQHGPDNARTMIAEQAASDVFGRTAVSTGTIGALTGGGALGQAYQKATGTAKGGLLNQTAKGAGQEALQEAPQSGGEKLIENIATREYLDPSQNVMEGVIADAASGAAIGGFMGGIVGAGGSVNVTRSAQDKAAKINQERERLGLQRIAVAGNVDEAIQAASDTVSQKPITTNDIWDDVDARNDLLKRAEQINQPVAVQNEGQTALTEAPATKTSILNQQITPQSTETGLNQAVTSDGSVSDTLQAQQKNNDSDSDIIAQNLGNEENAIVPPSRSPEERLKDRDSAIRLERELRNTGREYKITPMDMRDAVVLGNRTEQEAKQAENIAREFGKRVVWITADGPEKINGVVNSGIKDIIFVDVRSPNSAHAVVGHELSHHMENDAPQAYADMVESLKPFISGHQEYRAKYNIPEGMDIENVTKEMVGDVMGDNFNKPEFWKQVAEYNPSSFKRIADSVITWLKKLATKAKMRGLGSEQWISDIQKTQDIVAKAVAKYTTAKPGSTKEDDLKFALAIRKSKAKSVNDFVIPETPEYADNFTGDLANVPDNKKIPTAPLRVEMGKATGPHQGRGLLHMADNARRDKSRMPDRVTDDFAENLMRDALVVMKGVKSVHYDGDYAFVNPSSKRAIIAKYIDNEGYYAVRTVRPFIGGNKWGNSEWNGRLTFPSRETAVASPSESDHQDKLKPLPDRSGQDEIFREKITLPEKEDKSQVKKPAVKVKKKRKIESKFSSAADLSKAVVKDSLTGEEKDSNALRKKSEWFGGKPPHQMTEDEFLKLHKTGNIQPSAYSDYERDGGLSWLAADKKLEPLKELPEPYVLSMDGDKFFVIDETLPYAQPFAQKHSTEDAAIEEALDIINTRRGVGQFKTEKYPVVIEPIIGKSGKKYETRQTGKKKKYVKMDGDGDFMRGDNNELIYLSEREVEELGYPKFQQGMYVFDGNKPIAFVSNEFGAVGVYVEGKYQKEGIGSELLTRYLLNTPSVQIGQMTPAGENVTRAAHRKLSAITRKSSPDNDDTKFSRSKSKPNQENTDAKEIPETINIQGVERPTRNSEGNLIHPTEEGIKNFWKWFGDSRVVDDEGRPRVVYHGTRKDFNKFKDTNNKSNPYLIGSDGGLGFFFSVRRGEKSDSGRWSGASGYAGVSQVDGETKSKPGANIIPSYLKVESPYQLSLERYLDMVASGTNADSKEKIEVLGFDGISIAKETFVVFSPNQIKSATGNAGQFSSDNDDIRFSRSDTLSQAGVNTEESEKPSNLPEETKLQAFRRRSQDAMLRFKVMQKWLDKQGVKLSEAANVYQRENISKGKAANKVEDFRRDQLEPLIKRIAETSKKADKAGKFDLGDVVTYLEAVHIPEANERMRLIHKDDSATANGITDDQARKVIAEFEAMPNFAEFKKLAEEVRNIGSETLDMRLEAGLISQDQYDAYKATYKYWVPLRGNAAKQGFGKGLSTNAKDKRRMGHGFREDEFVLENLVQDRERALMQIEKNKVGMSVAQFLMEAENPNIGTIDTPQKMRVMKDFSYAVTFKGRVVGSFETEAGARNAINRVTEKSGDLIPDGESFTQTDFAVEKNYDPHIVMMARPQLAENEIQVYVNGHAVKLQLNDPGLARAATNAGIEQVGSIIHGARMFNRFLSKAYTAWSPDFMFMNMARDAYSGTLVLTGKKGAAFAAKTFTNYGTAIKELIKGRKDPKKSEWVKRYRAAGGNIGAAYLSDIERVGEDAVAALQEFAGARETFRMEYNAQISKGSSEKKARTMAALKAGVAKTKALPVVGHLFETIERVNMIIENALRLATFKTAIEQGESDQQAAMLSKDLMNFNRKGEVANMMGAAYLFYNPGMQGAHIVGEALFTSKHKKQVWALLGALTSMSFMLAELARGGGDDDDEREWENVPDYIKDRNLIFNVGDGQVTVPVAYGFGIFHAFGNYLSDLNHGADMNEVSIKLASGMFENFSVFGNPILDDDRGSEIRIDQILPTLPKLMMGPGINMDSLGRQIQPVKAQWNESIPDSQNMFRSVRGTAYEDVAHFMNDITGGNKYNPGAVDISPNTIKYWVTSLTGGAGRFVSDVTTGAAGAAEGVAPELENVPVLRKFFRQPGVTDSRASFYKAKREVDAASQRYKKAMKDGDAFNSQKMLDENQEIIWLLKFASDSAKMASAKRDWVLDIQQDESLTKADKKLKIKEIELQEQRVYDQFLSVFDDAKKR